VRCAAITKGGERCKADATSGSYCWSHAPENAEARRARGRKGGKARGAEEVAEVKRELRRVIDDVRSNRLERGVGAVLFQGFTCLRGVLELERKVRETDKLEAQVEELRARLEQVRKEANRWGS
jgi:hypothetical protein